MASTSTTLVYFCIITFRELASILDEEKSVINLIIKYSQRLLSYMYLKCVQICMFARKFEWNSSSFVPFPHIMRRDYESAGFGFCGGFKNAQTSCFSIHRNDADIKIKKIHTHTGVKRTYFCHRYVVFSIPICFLSSLSPPPL